MYACMHTHIHVYVCIHTCMYACMHAFMYACMHTHACVYVCMRASMHIHVGVACTVSVCICECESNAYMSGRGLGGRLHDRPHGAERDRQEVALAPARVRMGAHVLEPRGGGGLRGCAVRKGPKVGQNPFHVCTCVYDPCGAGTDSPVCDWPGCAGRLARGGPRSRRRRQRFPPPSCKPSASWTNS